MHQTFSANLQEKVQCETYIMHVLKKRGAYAYQTSNIGFMKLLLFLPLHTNIMALFTIVFSSWGLFLVEFSFMVMICRHPSLFRLYP